MNIHQEEEEQEQEQIGHPAGMRTHDEEKGQEEKEKEEKEKEEKEKEEKELNACPPGTSIHHDEQQQQLQLPHEPRGQNNTQHYNYNDNIEQHVSSPHSPSGSSSSSFSSASSSRKSLAHQQHPLGSGASVRSNRSSRSTTTTTTTTPPVPTHPLPSTTPGYTHPLQSNSPGYTHPLASNSPGYTGSLTGRNKPQEDAEADADALSDRTGSSGSGLVYPGPTSLIQTMVRGYAPAMVDPLTASPSRFGFFFTPTTEAPPSRSMGGESCSPYGDYVSPRVDNHLPAGGTAGLAAFGDAGGSAGLAGLGNAGGSAGLAGLGNAGSGGVFAAGDERQQAAADDNNEQARIDRSNYPGGTGWSTLGHDATTTTTTTTSGYGATTTTAAATATAATMSNQSGGLFPLMPLNQPPGYTATRGTPPEDEFLTVYSAQGSVSISACDSTTDLFGNCEPSDGGHTTGGHPPGSARVEANASASGHFDELRTPNNQNEQQQQQQQQEQNSNAAYNKGGWNSDAASSFGGTDNTGYRAFPHTGEASPLTYFEPVFRNARRYAPVVRHRKVIGRGLLGCLATMGISGVILLVLFLLKRGSNPGTIPVAAVGPQDPCKLISVTAPNITSMTLQEKIGQIMMVQPESLSTTDDIKEYSIGSILISDGLPGSANSAFDWSQTLDSWQAKAQSSRLHIPLVFATYAVHGNAFVKGATVFPHHSALGATRNAGLVAHTAAASALEAIGTGSRWTLAPTASVCSNPHWGRCFESFGETADMLSPLVQAETKGWQAYPMGLNTSEEWAEFAGTSTYSVEGAGAAPFFVAATAKYYLGDGPSSSQGGGVGGGSSSLSSSTLLNNYIPPFARAIGANIASILLAPGTPDGTPIWNSSYWIKGVLRNQLGFDGIVMAHMDDIQKIPGDFSEKILSAIEAGVDVFIIPDKHELFSSTLKSLIQSGTLPSAQLEKSVFRVIQLKQSLDLFQTQCAQTDYQSNIGSPEHRSLARDAVRQSLVLLKNEQLSSRARPGQPLFPLLADDAGGKKVLVIGEHANNIGLQCGGWTIDPQGHWGNITLGTTVMEGFQEVAGSSASLTYLQFDDGLQEADIGIIVVGETPYAQVSSNDVGLSLSKSNKTAITSVCGRMPCVVVLISGRPLAISDILPSADAVVAAWLPGSEASGIADVLFGDFEFSGTLPFSWFKQPSDIPTSPRSPSKPPLFPLGYGLFKNGNRIE